MIQPPNWSPRTYRRVWLAALATIVVVLVLLVLLFGADTAARWVEGAWHQYFGPAR